MAAIGSAENPLRVAIVGSGPAGFYAADRVLRNEDLAAEVDLFDRLPTPHGLVRAGVAPDHPKIKSVTRMYDKTAALPGFRFFGNVEIGAEIAAVELAERYHAVIHAYGASTDRRLGIPGEDLAGSHPATDFVAWYNAHPDFAGAEFDLSVKRAVIIGNGNVAADLARMLVLTRAELEETDTAEHAIEALAESGLEEIVVAGRRGCAQSAFTNPEVRELGELSDADIVIDPAEVAIDDASSGFLDSDDSDPTNHRNVDLFTEFAARAAEGKRRRVVMRFCVSPIELQGEERVERIVLGRNTLVRDPATGRVSAVDTGEREELDCGLVLRSIGYLGRGLDGLPFDARRGVIPNREGRAIDPDSGEGVPGLYAVGWIKRGPSGVIGTNKKDAHETVDRLYADLAAGDVPEPGALADREAAAAFVAERSPDFVTFSGWEAIDRAERERGEPLGRPRVKFCSVGEMLAAAGAGAGAAGE